MRGPRPAMYFPLRHGMREVPEVYGHVCHFLDREQAVGVQLQSCQVRVASGVEVLDDLAMAHEGEFPAVALDDVGEHRHESSVIAVHFFLA